MKRKEKNAAIYSHIRNVKDDSTHGREASSWKRDAQNNINVEKCSDIY